MLSVVVGCAMAGILHAFSAQSETGGRNCPLDKTGPIFNTDYIDEHIKETPLLDEAEVPPGALPRPGAPPTSLKSEAHTLEIDISINGESRTFDVEPRTLLVHLLRDEAGLTGTHVACETSICGACTVLLDDKAVKSCTVLAAQAEGCEVTTIEGMASGDELHALQEQFWEKHGLQCGYCTPGMIMTASQIIASNPEPTEQEIRRGLEGNICRCTGYQNIVDAVSAAAAQMRE